MRKTKYDFHLKNNTLILSYKTFIFVHARIVFLCCSAEIPTLHRLTPWKTAKWNGLEICHLIFHLIPAGLG